MKKIIIAMAAIAAAFTMASCNKEQPVGPGENTEGNDVITASTESALTKTALNGNDTDGYEVFWSEGDTFKLRDGIYVLIGGEGTSNGIFKGSVFGPNGWDYAYYPASYDGSNWPVEQKYAGSNSITGSPMTAYVQCILGQISGGKAEFSNVGGILRLTVKGSPDVSVTSITLSTDDLPDITLDCGTGVALDDTKGAVFHIAMPEGTYTGTSVLFMATDSRHCVKTLKADKPLVITRSKITPASIKIDKWANNAETPEGALSGTFTVSAEGKKVFFSKGNLCWNGSVFGFENNQYDINVAGHQSSFFWSNKAEYARGTEWNLDINAPMAFFTNADEVTANSGFTANGQTGLWRTLSKDEWTYLIGRDNGIGEATINGVKGVIIFPDEYDGQTDGLTAIPEGCVFLPAGREGGAISLYWSSTSLLNPSSTIPTAAALRYEDGAWPPYVVPDGMPEKHNVRLVTDIPNCPTLTFTVTFDMNGKTGTAPARYTGLNYRTTITKPADPVADGYTFWGWYKDKDCTVEWDFDSDHVTSSITLYALWRINGAISGAFTVNSSGKKVYFSKGNLWRDNNGLFHFEDNQDNFNKGNYNTSHISHFMWSKNAAVACAFEYNDPSASSTDVIFTNATQTTPNPNFTVNGQQGLWRTLSKDEWKYLIKNNGSLFTTIYGVDGLMIFSDGYSGEREGAFKEIPKGCLFLPAAGYRPGGQGGGEIISDVGSGLYWSSSYYYGELAYSLHFLSTLVDPENGRLRSSAYPVRLVTEVK